MKTTNQSGKMEVGRSIAAGAVAAVAVLCFAFTPCQKGGGEKWTAPATADAKKNPVASNAKSIADGKNLYMKNCKSCHGEGGKGDGPKAKKLDKDPGDFTSADFQKQSDGAIFWKTTQGKKPMPSFKDDLSDDQRWQVIVFLRSLK